MLLSKECLRHLLEYEMKNVVDQISVYIPTLRLTWLKVLRFYAFFLNPFLIIAEARGY